MTDAEARVRAEHQHLASKPPFQLLQIGFAGERDRRFQV